MTGVSAKRAVVRLVLFARLPEPGKAKTRLIPSLGAVGAARLHAQLVERSISVIGAARHDFELQYTGGTDQAFKAWLGNEIVLIPQTDGDLGDRLLAAIRPAPVIFFGADIPDLSTEIVQAAVCALQTHEVVIGPAVDGGYYLIGMRSALPFLFDNMPWGGEKVFAETCARLAEREIVPALLDPLHDCDRPEDLTRWPWLTA